MAYKDILHETIKNSGLSLREIASRCLTLELNITASYISQLQTGKLPPPSEEVSTTLAKVCKVDSTELIFQGHLEKAPELIRNYLILASETNKQLLELMLPYFYNKEINDNYNKMKENVDTISKLNLSIKYLKKLQVKNKLIPAFDLLDFVFKPKENYKYDEYELIFMEDDSMEPTIPKGSIIKYSAYINKEPDDDDVVIFEIIGQDNIMIRRYFKHINSVLFVADNKKYKMLPIEDKDTIIFIGKAVKFESGIE